MTEEQLLMLLKILVLAGTAAAVISKGRRWLRDQKGDGKLVACHTDDSVPLNDQPEVPGH